MFNIVEVIRNYNFAKAHMALLNHKRTSLSADLVKWRTEYLNKQQQAQVQPDPKVKDALAKDLTDLARKIEDKDREIAKSINEDGSKVIAQIHDHIKTVVDRISQPNGYHVVFAYPEFTTAEELNNPANKEMKLRPPAAMPFYVAPQVDITQLVVQTLNKWYEAPPLPVGVSPVAPGQPAAGAAPAPGGVMPAAGTGRP